MRKNSEHLIVTGKHTNAIAGRGYLMDCLNSVSTDLPIPFDCGSVREDILGAEDAFYFPLPLSRGGYSTQTLKLEPSRAVL